MNTARLLYIEDDPIVRHAVVTYMTTLGYSMLQAADGKEGLEIFRNKGADAVLTDLRLPKVDGLQILDAIKNESPDTPVIIVSGMGTIDDAIKAVKLGAWDYITKPIRDMALLEHAVTKALERTALVRENQRYQKYLEEEVKKRTAELHQAQKLEAIGTLAGGIAHDFNNILAAILGYSDLALEAVHDNSQLKSDLQQVKTAGKRARDLVGQILAFSRKSQRERYPIQIYPAVKEALKLLRASLPTSIEVRTNIATGPEKVMADPTEIHQIIMNLCTNSFHAMQEKKGVLDVSLGPVTVEPVTVEKKEAERSRDLKPGPYLRLAVKDTGCGMERDVMDRIFDPFFTTKEEGKGTGMGLSVVHGIVKEYDGSITVSSEPAAGTTFELFFPVTDAAGPEKTEDDVPLCRGDERVLLVDDDPALAVVGERMLKYLGYHVTSFSSPVAALQAFRAAPDDFDLVITDQTMPGLLGTELATELLQVRPSLPIVLCSGYSSLLSREKVLDAGIRAFLSKPLSIHQLAIEVRKVLSEGEQA